MLTSRFAWYTPPSSCAMSDGAGAATGGESGGGGGAAPPAVADFLGQIPEEIRGEAYFKDIKDVPGLATRAFHQAKMLGRDPNSLLTVPAADDAEAWGGVWNKLGRPEQPDGYQLTDPTELPPGLAMPNAEGKAAFLAEMHALGLSQKQADAVWQGRNKGMIDGFTGAMDELKTGLARVGSELKTQWGAAYNENIALGNLAMAHFATELKLGDALHNAVDATPGDSGIAIRRMLAAAGKLMQEHNIIGRASGGHGDGALAPAEAQQQIAAMWADPPTAAAMRDARHAGHEAAVAKLNRLHGFATPAG